MTASSLLTPFLIFVGIVVGHTTGYLIGLLPRHSATRREKQLAYIVNYHNAHIERLYKIMSQLDEVLSQINDATNQLGNTVGSIGSSATGLAAEIAQLQSQLASTISADQMTQLSSIKDRLVATASTAGAAATQLHALANDSANPVPTPTPTT